MIFSYITTYKKLIADLIFPYSTDEQIVANLNRIFPIHISTYRIHIKDGKHTLHITALSDYGNHKISALIRTLKYVGNKEAVYIIATALGEYLLETVASYKIVNPGKSLYIVPMPLAKKRLQKRGFNQIEILLKEITKQYPDLAKHIKTRILIKHKETKPQTKLNRKERLQNIKGAFSINKKAFGELDTLHISSKSKILKNADIILIDDVITTGSTVIEASKTLLNAGADNIYIITIARKL